jgi:hypothetical protein
MAAAAPASLRALAARGSSAQRGSSAPLLAPAQRTARRRVAAPARAGLFDGLFGKPPAKPTKPGGKPGGMKPISGSCSTCKNTGGIACKGCKGTGKNKANGNPFERFKCYDCQARCALRAARCAERTCQFIRLRCAHAYLTLGSPCPRRASATCRARRAGAAAAGSRRSKQASGERSAGRAALQTPRDAP